MLGHLYEMAQGSDVQITLDVEAMDLIPEALELARMGILPEGMYRNRSFAQEAVDPGATELAKQDLLYDPQTSGGLLIAVDAEDADAMEAALKDAVPSAQRIGKVLPYVGGKRIILK
jgi:selenide,water dikinase